MSSSTALDVIAIGDAIVDVIAECDDNFLAIHGLAKGAMRLLDPAQADHLYAAMGPAREVSGGSAANTLAGIAALGLSTAFVGQTASDQLGSIFRHDLAACGVAIPTAPLHHGPPTGRCLILVTPDAQRTMNTCPGASHELSIESLDPDLVRSAAITFLEGYLWGPERPRETMIEAARIARAADRKIAFTLSESLRLDGRREGVMQMIDSGLVDLVFGNEHEVIHLTAARSLDEAVEALLPKLDTLVVTRGSKGAIGVAGDERVEIAAVPVERVVDTTGAGDQFAAGFLAASRRGRSLGEALDTGARTAAEVISHFGARPLANLSELVQA